MRDKRAEKSALCLFRLLFFTFGTVWGYFVIRDTDVYPSDFGGPNNWGIELLKDMPYHPVNKGFLFYSLLTMGY
jgi:hypothetical protein